ncbi:MAG: UDP-N-acetyl-D-mannosamine dehydrogenase, partial [Alphaproteobacteria bacterium]
MSYDKICVVGLGYIGLPTAAIFALNGKCVIGLEISQSVVDSVNKGCAHIVEPGLDDVIQEVVAKGSLRATTVPE